MEIMRPAIHYIRVVDYRSDIMGLIVRGLENKYGNEEKKQQLKSSSNSVRDEIPNPHKNAAGNQDTVDYRC